MTITRRALGAAAATLAAPAIVRAQGRTLALWHIFNLETEAYMREGVRTWNAANAGARIEERIIPFAQYRTELVRAIATGDVPDLCVIDNPDTPSFAAQNQLTDLTARVAASARIKGDAYLPGPWSTTQWRGRTFAVPRDSNTIALYLNHEMFRAAGLDPTKPPGTWAEVVEAAKKLTSADGRVVGIMFSARAAEDATFQWLPWLWQTGADIDRLDSPEAAAALQVWVELVSSGAASRDVLTVSQSEGTNRLISGNAAMAISGPWDTPRVAQQARFEWSVAPLPVRGQGEPIRASGLGGWNWAIPQGSRNVDTAWRVIEHMSQAEIMTNSWISGRLAPRTDVTVSAPAYPQAFAAYSEQMKTARARGPHPRWPDLSRPIQQAIQQALSGQATPEAALRTAAGVIRPILAQVPLRG
jgi:multiple sugar transport system substrate-binding protein